MEDEPRRPATHVLGDNLDRLSVRDLEELKAALTAEIERVDREIAAKSQSREAAASVFKF